MSWFRKILRVFMVIALGAAGSIPFRLLPPPGGGPPSNSADRIVLQNDATKSAPQAPLQIAPPTTVAETSLHSGDGVMSDAPRTASKRPTQTTRKDLPDWNSKLESPTPLPSLPESFGPDGTATDSPSGRSFPSESGRSSNPFPGVPDDSFDRSGASASPAPGL